VATQINNKSKAHTRYRLQDGTIIPGVTTITGLLDKPAIMYWANNLGLSGIDVRKQLDYLGNIGTLAHYLVMCHLKGETPDTSDYTPNQLDIAENSLIKFMDWEKEHELNPVAIETPMVHEGLRYGGQPDWVGYVDDIPEIIDIKTADAIYNEHWYQVSGYAEMAAYNNIIKPQRFRILGLPRDDKGSFHEEVKNNLDHEFKVFQKLLELYQILKERK